MSSAFLQCVHLEVFQLSRGDSRFLCSSKRPDRLWAHAVLLFSGYHGLSPELTFNPLNAEFNPICHLLALLGAHHILHVSRIRVKTCRLFHFTPGLIFRKLYMVLALRLCVLYALLPCTILTDCFCITEVDSVYSTVQTESLYKIEEFPL